MIERPLSPPEPKEQCYEFKAYATVKVEGYVWASSYEEAKNLIMNKEYDDLEKIEIEEIEDIEELGEN